MGLFHGQPIYSPPVVERYALFQGGGVAPVRYAEDASGKWITIGGREEGEKKHVGGFPAKIGADGTIEASRVGGLQGKNVKDVKAHFDEQRGGKKPETVEDVDQRWKKIDALPAGERGKAIDAATEKSSQATAKMVEDVLQMRREGKEVPAGVFDDFPGLRKQVEEAEAKHRGAGKGEAKAPEKPAEKETRSKAASERAERLRQQDTEQRMERQWYQLMTGNAAATVADMTPEEAKEHLRRLDAAPGDNPRARTALESKAKGESAEKAKEEDAGSERIYDSKSDTSRLRMTTDQQDASGAASGFYTDAKGKLTAHPQYLDKAEATLSTLEGAIRDAEKQAADPATKPYKRKQLEANARQGHTDLANMRASIAAAKGSSGNNPSAAAGSTSSADRVAQMRQDYDTAKAAWQDAKKEAIRIEKTGDRGATGDAVTRVRELGFTMNALAHSINREPARLRMVQQMIAAGKRLPPEIAADFPELADKPVQHAATGRVIRYSRLFEGQPVRYAAVPDVRQEFSYDCGAAALRAVCESFGLRLGGQEVFVAMLGSTETDGTPPVKLVSAGQELGLTPTEFRGDQGGGILRSHIAAGCPVIVPMQEDGVLADRVGEWDGHYVVVTAADANGLVVQDPLEGPRRYDWPTFLNRWHDSDARGEEYRHYGIAFHRSGVVRHQLFGKPVRYVRDANDMEHDAKGLFTGHGGSGSTTTENKPASGANHRHTKPNQALPDQARPSATTAEREAIIDYTDDAYEGINRNLRTSKPLSGKYAEVHANLQSLLSRVEVFDKPVTTYRAMTVPRGPERDAFLEQMRQRAANGDTVKLGGYLSTTTNKKVADNFALPIRIEVEAVHGLDVKSMSAHPEEDELLLDDNTHFTVASVEKAGPDDEHDWVIKLKQLPPKDKLQRYSAHQRFTDTTPADFKPASAKNVNRFTDTEPAHFVVVPREGPHRYAASLFSGRA
jgi:predicted double-glycine peptidase